MDSRRVSPGASSCANAPHFAGLSEILIPSRWRVSVPGISRGCCGTRASCARAYLAMQAAGEDFATFLWDFVGGRPIQNSGRRRITQTALSVALSKALKARGFKFVGPVIVYAWMQAVGLVNDHAADCFRKRR